MLKIGLTGGIASGKSTISSLFAGLGTNIIDADTIARQLTQPQQPCYHQIIAQFGTDFILADGQLDRKALRHRVFADEIAKQLLEAILHPEIRKQLISQSDQLDAAYCILVIPLIIEASMMDLVDRILVIDSRPEQQLERLCQRDSMSREQALNMISQQCSREQRLEFADDIIVNTTTKTDLQNQVEQLHHKYSEISQLTAKSCQSPQTHGE